MTKFYTSTHYFYKVHKKLIFQKDCQNIVRLPYTLQNQGTNTRE